MPCLLSLQDGLHFIYDIVKDEHSVVKDARLGLDVSPVIKPVKRLAKSFPHPKTSDQFSVVCFAEFVLALCSRILKKLLPDGESAAKIHLRRTQNWVKQCKESGLMCDVMNEIDLNSRLAPIKDFTRRVFW